MAIEQHRTAPTATTGKRSGRRADPRGAIVFVSDRDSTPTVVRDQLYLRLHGGRVIRLTNNLDADWWLAPAGQQRRLSWSPDGRFLAFWGHPTPDLFVQADIFRMRADGTRVQNLTDDRKPAVGDIMPDWGSRAARR